MTPVMLPLQPLRPETFADFGHVVALSDPPFRSVNEGRGTRQDVPSPVAAAPLARLATTALYRLSPSVLPLAVTLLERHVLTEQVFWPLDAATFVVVVAPDGPDGRPREDQLTAFLAQSDQALVYGAGVWHLPLAVLQREAHFLMRMWESGSALDCEEHVLSRPARILG